ncbi:MAG: energy transducer TonB [Nitrospira sp.]|nr:energy transducer TonB [Nitrospira sp.]
MIAAGPNRAGESNAAHIQAWLISFLLHGTVALAAALTVKQIQLAPQDDTFKWNVAMVSPAQSVQSLASPQTQAPARSAPSTTSTPSPPVQRSAPTQSLPAPQPLARQTTISTAERTDTPVVTEPPPPQLTTLSPSATHPIQPAEPIRQETVAPVASPTESGVRQDETPMAVSTSTTTETERASAQAAILEQMIQSEHASAQTQVAAISPAPSNAPATRDYGWLSEAILRRVEELKRYPASARVDRAEGKVVVRAVINEYGNLGEVEVFQSSGHPGLDKAALDTLRQAAPFHLPRPLGQPHMTIKIPMSYRLDH